MRVSMSLPMTVTTVRVRMSLQRLGVQQIPVNRGYIAYIHDGDVLP